MLTNKTYTQEEISTILQVNYNDKKHYKRNITNILNTIGCLYTYKPKTITIHQQLTPHQLLIKMFIVDLHYSTATNFNLLILILYLIAHNNSTHFAELPYKTKIQYLIQNYNIYTNEKALYRLFKKLTDDKILYKDCVPAVNWYSYRDKEGNIIQKQIETEEEYNEYKYYYSLINAALADTAANSFSEAKQYAYSITKKTFYKIKPQLFILNFEDAEMLLRNDVIYNLALEAYPMKHSIQKGDKQ